LAAVGEKSPDTPVSLELDGRVAHTAQVGGQGARERGACFIFPNPMTVPKPSFPCPVPSHFLRCKPGGSSIKNPPRILQVFVWFL